MDDRVPVLQLGESELFSFDLEAICDLLEPEITFMSSLAGA